MKRRDRAAARLGLDFHALAVVHPFPSLLNALMVVALALVAGGAVSVALQLGLGMIGIQAAIGTVNDIVDAPVDALVKPHKPIPAGRVSAGAALLLGVAAGTVGLALSLVAGGPVVLALGMTVLGAGLVYDIALKPTAYAGLCYAVAFVAVPVYGWWGAVGTLPPRPELLLSVAALAGPTLQLANGLVDVESDRLAGLRGPVVRLGRHDAWVILGGVQVVIHSIAWLSLAGDATPLIAPLAIASASLLAATGWVLSGRAEGTLRELGWQAQAASIVLLGAAWLATAAEGPL